jgi:hypothetical protein
MSVNLPQLDESAGYAATWGKISSGSAHEKAGGSQTGFLPASKKAQPDPDRSAIAGFDRR